MAAAKQTRWGGSSLLALAALIALCTGACAAQQRTAAPGAGMGRAASASVRFPSPRPVPNRLPANVDRAALAKLGIRLSRVVGLGAIGGRVLLRSRYKRAYCVISVVAKTGENVELCQAAAANPTLDSEPNLKGKGRVLIIVVPRPYDQRIRIDGTNVSAMKGAVLTIIAPGAHEVELLRGGRTVGKFSFQGQLS